MLICKEVVTYLGLTRVKKINKRGSPKQSDIGIDLVTPRKPSDKSRHNVHKQAHHLDQHLVATRPTLPWHRPPHSFGRLCLHQLKEPATGKSNS